MPKPEEPGSADPLAFSPAQLSRMDDSMPSGSGSNDSDDFDTPLVAVRRVSKKRPLSVMSDSSDDDIGPAIAPTNTAKSEQDHTYGVANGSPVAKKSRLLSKTNNGVKYPSSVKQEDDVLMKDTAENQDMNDPVSSGSDSDAPLVSRVKHPKSKKLSPKLAKVRSNGSSRGKKKKEPKEAATISGNDAENGQSSGTTGSGNGSDPYRWWDKDGKKGSKKWTTLVHNAVLFPPEYVPHNIPLKYDGEPVQLEPKAEEVATFFAAKLETDYASKETFRSNFFKDFRASMVGTDAYHIVKDLDDCNFDDIHSHLTKLKQEKKDIPAEERKKMKEIETEKNLKYTVALVDGREEKVGNYRVEPPGLFLGRGEHPLMGKVKARINPEDITINIGEGAEIPPCPVEGHRWGEIVHKHDVTWLCGWKDSITGGHKYVWLSAGSTFKGMSDHAKFEKARKLHEHIEKIRRDYRNGWRAKGKDTRQRSVAMYLIDKLALRAGNEKGEDEADTVGCCSLRVEHIKFLEGNVIQLDFLGKDSMRYLNEVEVEKEVYDNLRLFCRNKGPEASIFHRLSVAGLNDYCKGIMDGLSAKVFRTYNASITLNRLLANTPSNFDLNQKIVFYNQQNKEVAILCNHQRTAPKTHDTQMEKFDTKISELMDWIKELKRGRKTLKTSKETTVEVTQMVPVKAEYTDEMNDKQRAEERKRAAAEPKVATPKTKNMQQIESLLKTCNQRLSKMKADKQVKEDLKTVALGTSKINYLDPRITVAWCKKNEVPIERIFAKTLMTKFAWAMEVSENFEFATD